MVPFGISLPIFSATRKRPVGVLKLPSSVPIPNRDVETGYVRIGCSFSFTVSCWSRIETWMLFIRIFLLATHFCYSVQHDITWEVITSPSWARPAPPALNYCAYWSGEVFRWQVCVRLV